MSSNADAWYVRFPDGRVLRATSTAVVRQQLGNGRIPPGSTVRRSPDEEWTLVEWIAEFADVVAEQRKPVEVGASSRVGGKPPSSPAIDLSPKGSGVRPPSNSALASSEGSGVAARLDPLRLQTVGVRGLVDELIGALDSTLVRKKIAVALLAALALGLLFALAPLDPLKPLASLEQSKQESVDRAWAALAVLVVGSIATALLTRMTFVEVSRLRPARWRETLSGLTGLSIRLSIAELVVAGNTMLIVEMLRYLPMYFLNSNPLQEYISADVMATVAVTTAMIAEVLQWPVYGLSLLLGPILAVEGCSVGGALLQWLRLIRRQLGRAFVYEALAVAVGLIITLPLIVPLATFVSIYNFEAIKDSIKAARTVLQAMALGPLFAYLAVANVFIYLNLRYETVPPKK
jgi:hypothetical protein